MKIVNSIFSKLCVLGGLAVYLLRGCEECPAATAALANSECGVRSAEIRCVASWEQFDEAGRIGANGRPFDPLAMTCATRLFPLGSRLVVTDVHNKLSVTVTVTDVTPRRYARRIDLSPLAFNVLNGLPLGICEVSARISTTDGH